MGVLGSRRLRQSIILMDSTETGTNDYGDAIHSISSLGSYPASVSVVDRSENEQGRDTFTDLYAFVVQASCPVEGVDSVTWNGSTYEVVGEPLNHMLPNGTVHHKEFQGRLYRG